MDSIMRGEKLVDGLKVDGKAVQIFELLFDQADKYICDFIELFADEKEEKKEGEKEEKKKGGVGYFEIRKQLFAMVIDCSNLSEAKFRKLAFSQIRPCIKVFKEINTPFLECLKELGIDPLKINLLSSLMSEVSDESSSEKQSPEETPVVEAAPAVEAS